MKFANRSNPFEGAPSKECEVCNKVFYNARFDKRGHRIGKYTIILWQQARFCSFSCRSKIIKNHLGKIKNNVGYSGLHKWVYRHLGAFPSQCDQCGAVGEKKNDRWTVQFANKSGLYKREKNDWLRLCVKCHRKHDKK